MDGLHYPYRFVCIAEQPDLIKRAAPGVEVRPLHFPNKDGRLPAMSVLDPSHGFDDRVIAIDLDVIVLGKLTPFLRYRGPICTAGRRTEPTRNGAVLVSFYPITGAMLWRHYQKARDHYDRVGSVREHGIYAHGPIVPEVWPNVSPGLIAYYAPNQRPPRKARLLSFQGGPPPQEITEPWITQIWSAASAPTEKTATPRNTTARC